MLIGWVDTEDIDVMNEWRDFDDIPEDVRERYLRAAYEQCLAFLPQKRDVLGNLVPDVPITVPERFRLAQINQARALFNSVISGPNDSLDAGGVSVTVFPMDWTVKNLLRPKRVGRVL